MNLLESPTAAKIAKRFYTVSLAVEQSTVPKVLRELIQLRVSQINGCGYCVDVHAKELAAAGETPVRISLVAAWRHSTVFTASERAALAFAEEGTRLADAAEGVADETFAALREHYDEDQVAVLIFVVALINAANRMGVIANSLGGSYEPGAFAALDG